MESLPPRKRIAIHLVALAIGAAALGCAGLESSIIDTSRARSAGAPRELVVLCRAQVLRLAGGTRSPGIVAQVFLTGGERMNPVAAPAGRFSFRAADGRTDQEVASWEFPADELARHRIDHSLGPCYAFWLPLEPADATVRKLVVYGQFAHGEQQLNSSPVRVVVPGK